MRDIIERLKAINNKHGYQAFLEHYKLPTGYYFKLDESGYISTYHFTAKEDDPFLFEDDYEFFKERLFFEGMLSSNKAVDAANKKIHSVTPNAMIFKYGIFDDPKLKEKALSVKDVLTKHIESLNIINDNSLNVEELVDKFMTLFEHVKETLKDTCKDEDKILIFLDNEVLNYKKYYDKYLVQKIFIKNDTIIEIDNVTHGTPSFSFSLNTKKTTLSKNPYGEYAYRVTFEEAILLNYFNKLKLNSINELLEDSENDYYKTNIQIDLNSNTKSREIINYDINLDNKENEKELNIVTLLQSEFTNEKPIIDTLNRSDLLKKIDWHFRLEEKSYLFSNLLKITNGDYKDFALKCKTNDIQNIFISNKDILNYYFNENGDIFIDKELSKIMYLLYLEMINKDYNPKILRMSLDFMITALDYVNKNGGYNKMPDMIKQIWTKLVKAKEDKLYSIDSNEEFFFVSGQLLYWLSTLSESSNNTSSLLQDVLDIRSSTEIKNKSIDKYRRYSYSIPVHSLSFLNILYSAVLAYEIETEIKLKDFKYKYYYNAGLIGKNIKFEVVKNKEYKEDISNEE